MVLLTAKRGKAVRIALSTLVSVSVAGCGAVSTVKSTFVGAPQLTPVTDATEFIGGVAADEPRAALIGKQILAQGGSAGDAAAAMALALAVTLPSRAGLGGGGACLAYDPAANSVNKGRPEAILFTSTAPGSPGGDRPAAVPMLARGVFALHDRYGVLPVQQVVAPAEQLARLGVPVSRAFAEDLAVVGPALLADPAAAAVFGPDGSVLAESDMLSQPDLGTTLARLRVQGVDDLYSGGLSQVLVAHSAAAGGPVSAEDLQAAAARLGGVITLPAGKDQVSFLPLPADGGVAAAAAFQYLQSAGAGNLDAAQARALGAASLTRTGGADAGSALAAAGSTDSSIGVLPASTSFVAMDRRGGVVACAVSMGNLFGTGRVVPGTGILLAASPAAMPPPLLAAAVAWNEDKHAFRAAVAGSGQAMAALGVALGMFNTLKATTAIPSVVPGAARINAIACPKYLPGNQDACTWATDPRGAGFALGNR